MNYEEIVCDANNLYRAYKASVKTSKWKETTQKFMMNFLRYIFSIQDDLINRTLQNGPTQEFTLFERGRVRPITSIQIRDRIIRHVLCDEILLPEVKKHIIYDNCASIKGRGISHQRDRFEVHLRKYYRLYGNEGWILFGDFSKFYDNIIHEIAKRELLRLFDDDEFIDWLLTQIFDGFKIDVSYMTASTYKFLQIKYSLTDSGKVIKRINPKRVTAMRRKLKRLAVKVKNEEISYENVENMFRSWMGGFYKLLSKEQRKNLIGLYEDLFEKSIEIVNKKMIIVDKTR